MDWIERVALSGLLESERGGDPAVTVRVALSRLPRTWRNVHGDEVEVVRMSGAYLAAAIKFSVRAAVARRARRVAFYARSADVVDGELGAGAQDAFDMEFQGVLESDWRDHACPRLAALVLEARARGLQEGREEWLSGYGEPYDAAATMRELEAAEGDR